MISSVGRRRDMLMDPERISGLNERQDKSAFQHFHQNVHTILKLALGFNQPLCPIT